MHPHHVDRHAHAPGELRGRVLSRPGLRALHARAGRAAPHLPGGGPGRACCSSPARIADGWISGPLNTTRYMTRSPSPTCSKGLAAAGRAAAGFERCVMKPCVVHQDARHARALARNAIAVYGAPCRTTTSCSSPMGFAPATQAIRAALQRGDIPGMLDAVTEEMIDALVLAGTPDEVRRQLVAWEGLCDLLLLYCPPALTMDPAETRATHEAIIETFAT